MSVVCTEPCKILDGRWRCVNCNMPRATRWGTVKIGPAENKVGWWCQTCIDAIFSVHYAPPSAPRQPAS